LKYTLLGMLSGLFSFLFINTVTRMNSLLINGNATEYTKEYTVLFAFIILFFIWTRRTLSLAIIKLSQRLFWKLRKQIIALVLEANYKQLEERKDKIHSAIVNDVNILTQASLSIIDFFTSVILALSCLVYLVMISKVLFLVTLGIAFTGMIIYHFRSRKDMENFQNARNLEDDFITHFNSILDGFKEIFMDPRKGQVIFNHKIKNIANEAYANNTSAYTGFLNSQITGQVLFYILISSILLFFSVMLGIETSDTVNYVFTLLYLLGAIETIMVVLPALARARVSSGHVFRLKTELEEANFSNPLAKNYLSKSTFNQIQIRDLEFRYKEAKNGFGIGPIELTVPKGEIVFIYGGNGSGKTTFIQALLGLLVPDKGKIYLNNELVTNESYSDYKAIFSVVFSDYYLFDNLLAVDPVDIEKWEYYIKLFEMEDKVSLEGHSFSTTSLSMGQRKRLALIAALMENKPVLVIDEWAADQDPYFRKKFYTRILPELKEEGLTILAVTHDDKYYHCADVLYKMEEGMLIQENITEHKLNYIQEGS